jgi:hypothetical protein
MGASGIGKAMAQAALEVGPDLTAIIEQFLQCRKPEYASSPQGA